MASAAPAGGGSEGAVISGPWPAGGAAPPPGFSGLWDLLPTGRLSPRMCPYVAPGPGRPAMVSLRAKPRCAFTREDLAYCAEQAALPAAVRRGPPPQEPYFVGEWDMLPVDPTVWGWGGMDLTALTVKAARLRLMDSSGPAATAAGLVSAAAVPGYAEHSAVYPAIWTRDYSGGGGSGQQEGSPAALATAAGGLPVIEGRWRASADLLPAGAEEGDGTAPAGGVDLVPPWLDLATPRAARQGVAARDARAERRQQGETAVAPAPAALLPLRQGFAGVWRRLMDKTVHRPYRVTMWRVLHGVLGCGAFLFHVRRTGSPYCTMPCCAGQQRVDDLTHALLDCPASAPAVAWLLSAWHGLTGLAAPNSPAFLLGDDPAAGWDGCSGDDWLYVMWTRLRVATFGAIWRVRSQAQLTGRVWPLPAPRQAALMAVEAVVASVQRDWMRARQDVRRLGAGTFCADWWRGRDPALSREQFCSMWAPGGTPPVFCEVVGGELAFRLGVDTPVPLPLA